MEEDPPGGGFRPPDLPPINQTLNTLVPVTPVPSTDIVLPTVRQLHYQWSNLKFRSLILGNPKRSSTEVDALTTGEVQDELLNYTPHPGEEHEVHTQLHTSNLRSVLRQEDYSGKDKHV
jgi:hypothetical protein